MRVTDDREPAPHLNPGVPSLFAGFFGHFILFVSLLDQEAERFSFYLEHVHSTCNVRFWAVLFLYGPYIAYYIDNLSCEFRHYESFVLNARKCAWNKNIYPKWGILSSTLRELRGDNIFYRTPRTFGIFWNQDDYVVSRLAAIEGS